MTVMGVIVMMVVVAAAAAAGDIVDDGDNDAYECGNTVPLARASFPQCSNTMEHRRSWGGEGGGVCWGEW
eukprot:gene12076-biopygen2703